MLSIADRKSDLEFAVNTIKGICIKRNNEEAVIRCNLIILEIQNLEAEGFQDEVQNLKPIIINLIDELKFIIQTEIRFVLFPLPDIKKEAYELGKKYMKNFLEWIKEGDDITPEKLLGILEEEIYRLEEANNIVDKNHF
jgi:hypothetical protein